MNPQPVNALTTAGHQRAAMAEIGRMVCACIQCGTCTGSCPNAAEMDLTPRHMWRLVILGRLETVMASRTFILCSDCYTCSLRCPRGLPLTAAMERLKGIAFARREARHRRSRHFYEQFIQTVRRHGRIHEMEFMTRYFTAMRSPAAPFRFAPLGVKLMGKGKLGADSGNSTDTPLGALFDKVAALEQAAAPDRKEGRR
jgi:heterodisulfide reductase subunit C